MLYGALPHVSAHDAHAVLQRNHMPYVAWPQLPQRHFFERSIVQASWGFPGVILDEAQRRVYVMRDVARAALPAYTIAFLRQTTGHTAEWTRSEAAGLLHLLDGIADVAADCGLKGQLLGPISLAAQLTDEHQQPLVADPVLFEGVVIHCCLRARLQAAALMRTNRPALVCIEEPFADVMRSPFMTIDRDELLVALARVLLAVPCARGLAIRCGNPLSDFGSLPLDLLMITHWDNVLMRDSDFTVLVSCINKGVEIGLGVVSVSGTTAEDITSTNRVVYAIIERFLQAGLSPSALRNHLVIAPMYSLGQVPIAEAEAVVALTCACAAALDARLIDLIASITISDLKE